MRSENINELAAALSKAQSQMESAHKDGKNPHFNSSYPSLQSVWEACRKPLGDNGLAVTQTVQGDVLETMLMHVSGQWIGGVYPLKPMKPDPQTLGSCVTYARRYSLMAIVGISADDDDGNRASNGHSVNNNHHQPALPSLAEISESKKSHSDGGIDSYEIKFGKFRGLKLGTIPLKELNDYANYIQRKADAEGKPATGAVGEFIQKVKELQLFQAPKAQGLSSPSFSEANPPPVESHTRLSRLGLTPADDEIPF